MKKSVLFFGLLLVIDGVMFPSCQDVSASVDYIPEEVENKPSVSKEFSSSDDTICRLVSKSEYTSNRIDYLHDDDVIVSKTENDDIKILVKSIYPIFISDMFAIDKDNYYLKNVLALVGGYPEEIIENDIYQVLEIRPCNWSGNKNIYNSGFKEILIISFDPYMDRTTFYPIKILL